MINGSQGVKTILLGNSTLFGHQNDSINVTGRNFVDPDVYSYSYDDYLPPEMDIGERAKAFIENPIGVFTLVFCFLSIIMNISLVMATLHVPGGIATHKKFIISLAVSDLLTSLSVLSHEVNKVVNQPLVFYYPDPNDRLTSACIITSVHAFNITAHIITLLNLVAMALDHYIAILKPLRYNVMMSKRRGVVIICCLWFLAVIAGFSNFIAGLGSIHHVPEFLNYCEYVIFMASFQSDYIVYAMVPVSVIIIAYVYLRVYCVVRNLNRTAPSISRDLTKTMKATVTTLFIIGSFTLCWLPKCILEIVLRIRAHIDPESLKEDYDINAKVTRYLYVLMLLNCILDPIIYALRLPDIQIGYRRICCRLCRRCNCNNSTISSEQLSTRRSTATTIKYFSYYDEFALQELNSKLENETPLLEQGDSKSSPSVANGYVMLPVVISPANGTTDKRPKEDPDEA